MFVPPFVMEEIPVKSPATFTWYGLAAVPLPLTVVFVPSSNLANLAFTLYVFCFVVASSVSSTVTLSPATTLLLKPVITFLPSFVILERSFLAMPLITACSPVTALLLPSRYVIVTSPLLSTVYSWPAVVGAI